MSKKRNRAKLNKARDNYEYNRKLINWLYPPYYEEGWNFTNGLRNHKWREYKTWKYNRKTKWK